MITAKSANSSTQIIVSPITTLIQASVAAGATPAQAAQQVAAALNLTGVDLLSADPMTNQAVYAKTVAVQELVEQIAHSVESLGGTVSTADTFAALQAAIQTSTASGSTDTLLNTATITAAISNTLDKAEGLSQATTDNLANVKTNLAALTASVIAANVESVQNAVIAAPASAFSADTGSIESIKNATQAAVVAAKEAVATQQIIEALAPALIQAPASVSESLAKISEAVATNSGTSAADIAAAVTEIGSVVPSLNVTEITNNVQNANSFYADYLKLNGFSVQATDYTPAQLNGTLSTPVDVNSLNNLLVGISGVGKYATGTITETAAAALNITVNSKSLTITADKLSLEFTAGTLTKASIPQGAKITVASTLNTVASTNIIVDVEKNVLSNGKIALNTTTLGSLSSSLASQLTNLSLKDQTATVTAVISATPKIAIVNTSNPALATKYTVGAIDGSGISAKFKVTQ